MWFPLHPIGFLMAYSYPLSQIAWSIFIGWLIKVIVLRLGGVDLFRRARFVMTGLIFGEACAAGFWLVTSLILNASGITYHTIRLFPP